MEKFKNSISGDEFNRILGKEQISLTERFKIDSFTSYTLVDKIGNLKNEELNEVYYLEAKNLYRVMNTAALLLGVFNEASASLRNLTSSSDVRAMFCEIDASSSDNKEREKMKFSILANYLLSNCDMRNQLRPIFEGKIPKKIFSFRQDEAEEWFKNFTTIIFHAASTVLVKMDAENAFAYVCSNIGWYLNKSQTFKYHKKSTDKDMNEAINRILKEFVISVGGDMSYIKNNESAPLYKDL